MSAHFPKSLLNELLALASPVGIGAIEVSARRNEALDALLDQAVLAAGINHRGERNQDLGYNFDYVSRE